MNSWTPASRAPGVSVRGRMCSQSVASSSPWAGVSNRGVQPDPSAWYAANAGMAARIGSACSVA